MTGSKKTLLQEVKNIDTIKTDNIKTNISRLNEPEGAGDNTLYSIEDAPPQNDYRESRKALQCNTDATKRNGDIQIIYVYL